MSPLVGRPTFWRGGKSNYFTFKKFQKNADIIFNIIGQHIKALAKTLIITFIIRRSL
jgi:hypothetical protein